VQSYHVIKNQGKWTCYDDFHARYGDVKYNDVISDFVFCSGFLSIRLLSLFYLRWCLGNQRMHPYISFWKPAFFIYALIVMNFILWDSFLFIFSYLYFVLFLMMFHLLLHWFPFCIYISINPTGWWDMWLTKLYFHHPIQHYHIW